MTFNHSFLKELPLCECLSLVFDVHGPVPSISFAYVGPEVVLERVCPALDVTGREGGRGGKERAKCPRVRSAGRERGFCLLKSENRNGLWLSLGDGTEPSRGRKDEVYVVSVKYSVRHQPWTCHVSVTEVANDLCLPALFCVEGNPELAKLEMTGLYTPHCNDRGPGWG